MRATTAGTARPGDDPIDFGDAPPAVNEIRQRGVTLHRTDRAGADRAFREALALDPEALATYFCLYEIHTCSGDLDAALAAAEAGARVAARAANLAPDRRDRAPGVVSLDGPARFALYTLKALAFIRLRRGEPEAAREALEHLARLDPDDAVGGSVVEAIRRGATA